jgi:diguanylate cyclase (GGDEF)-like protein
MYKDKNEVGQYRVFFVTLTLLMTIAFAMIYFIEREVRSARFEIIETNEKRVVSLENDYIGNEFRMVLSDLNFIDSIFDVGLTASHTFEEIKNEWMHFSTERFIYDKIRFIDTDGNERIRINHLNDEAYDVPKGELQNKASRYYFQDTMKLDPGVVYVSPMDLDMEGDQIVEPHIPLIRFAKQHYDEYGNSKGILVLDYRAKDLLEAFKKITFNSNGEMALLNSGGYWLSAQNSELEWRFMSENEKDVTFKNQYPVEWNTILKGKTQFLSENGLFTSEIVNFKTIIDSSQGKNILFGDGHWYIVSVVPRKGEYASTFVDIQSDFILNLIKDDIIYFLMVIIISLLIAFLFDRDRSAYSKMKYYSEYDTLTKVLNRRAGITRLKEMFPINDRRHFLLSVCFVDVNGLKQVNDKLGHKLGDELIVTVADVVKRMIRDNDFIIRMGGDEFLIVFDDLDSVGAETVWERIVDTFEQINDFEHRPYLISVSHGMVSHNNKENTKVDELIKWADEKMYVEKNILKTNLNVIRKT